MSPLPAIAVVLCAAALFLDCGGNGNGAGDGSSGQGGDGADSSGGDGNEGGEPAAGEGGGASSGGTSSAGASGDGGGGAPGAGGSAPCPTEDLSATACVTTDDCGAEQICLAGACIPTCGAELSDLEGNLGAFQPLKGICGVPAGHSAPLLVEENGCEHFLFYSGGDARNADGSLTMRLWLQEFDFLHGAIRQEPRGEPFTHSPPWAAPEAASFWDDWELSPSGATYAYGHYPHADAGQILTVDTVSGELTEGPAERGWLGFLDDDTLLAGTGTVGPELIALRAPFTEANRTVLTTGFTFSYGVEVLHELGLVLVRGSNVATRVIPFARIEAIIDDGAPVIDVISDPDLARLDTKNDYSAFGSDYLMQGTVVGSNDWTISDLVVVDGVLTLENTRDFIQSKVARNVLYYGSGRTIMLFQGGAIYGTIQD